MRKNGIDKLAFLVVLSAAALVVLAAAGTGPAYSDDSRTDPAQMHRVSTAETSHTESTPAAPSSEPQTDEPREQTKSVDQDGYEWSGSRPADERYLWSHRPSQAGSCHVMGPLLAHLQSLAKRGNWDDEPPSPLLFPDLGLKRLLEGIRRLANGTAEAPHTLEEVET